MDLKLGMQPKVKIKINIYGKLINTQPGESDLWRRMKSKLIRIVRKIFILLLDLILKNTILNQK